MTAKKITKLFAICLIGLLFSCNTNESIPVHFERYDQAVFSSNIATLREKHPDFTPFYFDKIIQIGNKNDSLTTAYFNEFVNTYKNNAYDSVQAVFPNMDKIEKELGQALGNYKAIFPNDSLPQFYCHFSGFNDAIIHTEKIISVSLEQFLGNSSFYDQLGIYQYLRKGMYPEKISMEIVKRLLLRKINTENATENVLSAIIYQGKILYALQEMFPNRDVEFLLHYSTEQKEWCEANEPMMWSFMVKNKHLFSSDYKTIRSYITPAPFTKGFPMESPGQTGNWIGFQIVKNYIKNTNITLAELLQNADYQEILQKSNYNPDF